MEEITMKKVFLLSITAILILSGVLLYRQVAPAQASDPIILTFNTMVGVPPALTGTQNPIRGINGGGLPWMLSGANGLLTSSGMLVINIRGLVLAAGPNAGLNPIANFRATVSCLTDTGSTMNVTSDLFPATTGSAQTGGGNANIHATLALPQPCLAPIVFVTSPGGAWFAVTGN
jgi:hypothetical protein